MKRTSTGGTMKCPKIHSKEMWWHLQNHVIDIKTGKPTIDFVFGALEPFHGTWLLTRAKRHELKVKVAGSEVQAKLSLKVPLL